ncbi:hypothetical protein BC03BB108_B0268 (plasmid) [Bacillus cereus 03BB108]|nr:hypothetical protein BC03BB108_B0268 [Bacillus cereus 03BB108]
MAFTMDSNINSSNEIEKNMRVESFNIAELNKNEGNFKRAVDNI